MAAASKKGKKKRRIISIRRNIRSLFGACLGKSTSAAEGADLAKTVPISSGSNSIPSSREIHIVKTDEAATAKTSHQLLQLAAAHDHHQLVVHNKEKGENLDESNGLQVPIKQVDKQKNWIQEPKKLSHSVSLLELPRRAKEKEKEKPAAGGGEIESNVAGEFEPIVGALIILVTLIVMLIWGKVCAVVCTAVWFYLIPRLRAHMNKSHAVTLQINNSKHVIDFDSPEYKKKVVLKGLLERN